MSVVFQRGNAEIRGNLTPMIDMTFLLIVFFVLVSRIVDLEVDERLNLVELLDPATEKLAEENRVVINIVPASGGAVQAYRIAGREYPADPAGLAAVTAQLAGIYRANPAASVNLRADRRTHYVYVEPMIEAISTAAREAGHPSGAARVNLVVVKEE